MPQMAPLSWLILFFLFTATFFLFNIMNYFNKMFINLNKNTKMNNKEMKNLLLNKNNWKW
uniref:ATP synthase F0 subunit 8 n=1 Tax=Thienemanniella majuscula TaxID=611686 RepID=UPI0028D888C1|nr:ATP synthase F0 subunit 8 [Thienemanniella majuscula]WML69320.1 ATP synthase F0 subunit 8 [Thienemanniella majuscula]